jgi:hypothetical protein
MKASGCSTGPSHTIEGEDCIDGAQFLQDGEAGLTLQEAMDAHYDYYHSTVRKGVFGRVIVTNHPDATSKAKITLASAVCFGMVVEAQNLGEIEVQSGVNTHVIVAGTTVYPEADAITVSGEGSFTVINTINSASIDISTTGKVEVYGVVNSGPITAMGSPEVIIAHTHNMPGAVITASNIEATLIDVINEGSVVFQQGGKVNAYGIVNTGSVSIDGGTVHIETVCPSTGTITMSAGVTGSVTYQEGCEGTISIPDGVTKTMAPSASGTPPCVYIPQALADELHAVPCNSRRLAGQPCGGAKTRARARNYFAGALAKVRAKKRKQVWI